MMSAPTPEDKCMRGRTPVMRSDGSIEIPLTKGQIAVVDPVAYPRVCGRKWYAMWCKCTETFYAASDYRRCNRKTTLLMHREAIGERVNGTHVDHINHDTLDNRSENLRASTPTENHRNSKPRRGGASRFKGVSWHAMTSKWRARIYDPKERSLGYFDTEEDAAEAYDRSATESFGAFAHTNRGAGILS